MKQKYGKEMYNKYFVILGAPDPEMNQVEEILQELGILYGYLAVNNRRVNSGNAYNGDSLIAEKEDKYKYGKQHVFIECGLAGTSPSILMDHHHPGNHGYGRPPAEYWEASSIGQFCNFFGIEPTDKLRLVAAGDHCPLHAYQGKCPGVDPDALMRHRISNSAKFMNMSEEDVMTKVLLAMELIKQKISEGADVPHFVGQVDMLPEASLRLGQVISYEMTVDQNTRVKVGVLNGDAPFLTKWMTKTAPEMGLIGIYGDSERGYAGGYRP